MKYNVRLTTLAYMRGNLTVDAADPIEAEMIAMQRIGDVDWQYDGVCDQPDQGPEVMEITGDLKYTLRDACIEALAKEFPYVSRDDIEKSVFTPESDPGGWSPKSLLVVHLESGLPDVFMHHSTYDNWDRVEKALSKVWGKSVFFESINPAVTALWEG